MTNIKIKKLLLIISALVIVSAGVIKTTLSAFTSNDEIVNKFEIGDVNIENEEDFDETPESYENIKKIVSIKNVTTKSPVLVRVNITPRWVEIKDGKEIPWSGDASANVVTLNYSNNIIQYDDFPDGKLPDGQWMDGKDGYYYYTSILPAEDNPETNDIKENETSKILESVKIDLTNIDNKDDYEGKTLIVDVNSEAVQPTEQAYIDAWGENLDDDIKTMLNGLLEIGNNNSEGN